MLIPVTEYEQVAQRVNPLLLQAGMTNGIPDREKLEREIARGTLYLQVEDFGLFLFRKREKWDHLNFLLKKGESLQAWNPHRPTVVELPFRKETDPMETVAGELETKGFRLILERIRYTRKGKVSEPFPGVGVGECKQGDLSYGLLEQNFSPLTGCIPDREEWEILRNKGQILTLPGGVLHYEIKGKTTELRHLAVDRARRRQGFAGALVGEYLNRWGRAMSRVWTGKDNIAAQRLYESFGYEKDSLTSRVYYFDKEF